MNRNIIRLNSFRSILNGYKTEPDYYITYVNSVVGEEGASFALFRWDDVLQFFLPPTISRSKVSPSLIVVIHVRSSGTNFFFLEVYIRINMHIYIYIYCSKLFEVNGTNIFLKKLKIFGLLVFSIFISNCLLLISKINIKITIIWPSTQFLGIPSHLIKGGMVISSMDLWSYEHQLPTSSLTFSLKPLMIKILKSRGARMYWVHPNQ